MRQIEVGEWGGRGVRDTRGGGRGGEGGGEGANGKRWEIELGMASYDRARVEVGVGGEG